LHFITFYLKGFQNPGFFMNPDQFKDNKFPHSPATFESLQNSLGFTMNNSQNLALNNPNFLNGNGLNKSQNYMGKFFFSLNFL